MKFATMRFLEKTAGRVIILLLIFMKYLGFPYRRHRKNISEDNTKTILILKFFGLGSIINAFPLIEILRKNFPKARIVFATFQANNQFLEITKRVDEVITVNPDSLWTFFIDSLRTLVRVNKAKVDICIDLEFFSKYGLAFST